MDAGLARSPGTRRGFRGLKCGHERSVPSGCGSAGASAGGRVVGSSALSGRGVPDLPMARSPGGNPGACSRRAAVYRGLARRRQSASEGERKSVARGMRGLRARWGRRSGGLRRGGLVHGARGLGCAPSPARALRCPQVRGRVGQGALDLVQGMEQGSLGSSAGRWRAGSLE